MAKTSLLTGLLMERESSFGCVFSYAKCRELQSKGRALDHKLVPRFSLPTSEAR